MLRWLYTHPFCIGFLREGRSAVLISWFETLTAKGLHNIIVSCEVLIGGRP